LIIPEVKAIAKDNPLLLEGYTMEEAQMLADLEAKCNRKHCEMRCRMHTNNTSMNADIKRTMARLVEEVCSSSLSLFFLKKKTGF
jgi:hypothetical protein